MRSVTAQATRRRLCVLAPTYPLTVGAAHFNSAMVAAMRGVADVEFLSWKRPYPTLLYRGPVRDDHSRPPHIEPADFILDWNDPRTWREAVARAERFGADTVVLPWLHPVMAPPYAWMLRATRDRFRRIVICHNVLPHERTPFATRLARGVLRRADTLVTHAPAQRGELRQLGVTGEIVEAFHPLFATGDLAPEALPGEVAEFRARSRNPTLLLLLYGAVRPYKGVDLALEALARVDPILDVRLVVAGRFWKARAELERLAVELGVDRRVEFRDGYVSNEETSILFGACDAALLPYRSATQSGVAALAFGYGRPVIATAVGGLPAAIEHGVDGLLSEPDDPSALARAIERLAREREMLTRGAERTRTTRSFESYAELLLSATDGPRSS
ncbi:MAG TPA: glycosyltransferase [Gaiellaceae bacterium]|nr:glycosyltransferase [Gaiellaceae bacterium]